MRKIIIAALMAASVMPATAMAQSRAELRHDTQRIHQEQRELRQAQRYGTRHDVREERRDLRRAKQEYREDWRDHRKAHRNVYARGKWNAPFRYYRWREGYRMKPAYYSARYYIGNPATYRLPAAGPHMRYVRHYDDILLVNVRTGVVVRVYRNFFW